MRGYVTVTGARHKALPAPQKEHVMRTFRLCSSLVVLAFPVVVSSNTFASPVTVAGAFTNFAGTAANGTIFSAYLNSNLLDPQQPLPSDPSGNVLRSLHIGSASVPLSPPTVSVDFYRLTQGVEGTHNIAQFTSGPAADATTGMEFLLGTFTFTNGSWFGNPQGDSTFPDTQLNVSLTTQSSDSSLDGHNFSDSLTFVVTAALSTDPSEFDADFFYIVGHPELGSIRIYELVNSGGFSNTGSVDLYGRIDSLTPTRFANPQGGLFLDPNISYLPTTQQPVPGPSTFLLLGAGLGGLTLLRRNARKQ